MMTTTQYLKALQKLKLLPNGQRTARLLGLSVRQIQKLAAGHQNVGPMLARLIEMYLRHGLPREGDGK